MLNLYLPHDLVIMKVYFDIIKLIFFLLTILVSLFQLRIKWVVSKSFVDNVWPYIMPIYFIFIWLIIGYIIGYILDLQHNNSQEEKDYIMWFIVWVILWIILAFIYYSFVNV